MEINGVAHITLTVANFPRAREFYGKLLPFLGLVPLVDVPDYIPGKGHFEPAKP
jgi:catechol 2,3-dioxygenase-like lactoylglutathione lyase family enzyme